MEQFVDYITGKQIDFAGSEKSRQIFEEFLVVSKGFNKTDVKVDVPLVVQFKGEDYHSCIDLVVCCDEIPFMAVTCVAGSIGSYEREILAGARLLYEYEIPLAVSTDGENAVILDTVTGSVRGKSLDAIPSKSQSRNLLASLTPTTLPPEKREGEMIIYRSFNLEKVNR